MTRSGLMGAPNLTSFLEAPDNQVKFVKEERERLAYLPVYMHLPMSVEVDLHLFKLVDIKIPTITIGFGTEVRLHRAAVERCDH